MKMTFFSKTISIGLIAVLSIAVGTSMRQTASAQVQGEVQSEFGKETTCEATLPNGQDFFYDLQGIELSAEQFEAFDSISINIGEKIGTIIDGAQGVVDSGSTISFVPREGSNLTNEQMKSIYAAYESFPPTSDKIESLTEEFGQYGEFRATQRVVLTPEGEMTLEELEQDYNNGLLSVMTPDQQQQYRENMEVRSRINACSVNDPTYR